jgi:hypothetical protein
MSLLQIMEGWKNHLVPAEELKDIIDVTMKERKAICLQCPHHSTNVDTIRPDDHCTLCGCPDVAKLKCLSCMCFDVTNPRWRAVDVKSNTEENEAIEQ